MSGQAAYNGMAGTSIGLNLKNTINLQNPALWSYNDITRFQISYKQNQTIASDNNRSTMQTDGSFDGIQVLFVADTASRTTFGLGINSQSNQNYQIVIPQQVTIEGLTVVGNTEYIGVGGITNFFYGGSTELFNRFTLGLYGKSYVGRMEETVESEFAQNYAFTTRTRFNRSFSGFGLRAGLSYRIDNLLIGAFYEPPTNMSVNLNTIYQSAVNADTTFSNSQSFVLPSSYGIGMSYLTGKFLIGADFQIQDFSNLNYRNRNNVTYGVNTNSSIGFTRLGSRFINADYFDRVSYKAGLGFRQNYYSVNNTAINEYLLGLGMALPLPNSGILDLSAQIGNRGTTANNNINELFMRFNFSLSIGETWFVPFKRDND